MAGKAGAGRQVALPLASGGKGRRADAGPDHPAPGAQIRRPRFRLSGSCASIARIELTALMRRHCAGMTDAREGDWSKLLFRFFEHKEAPLHPLSAQLGIIRHVEVT